jgi:hypothetical protein
MSNQESVRDAGMCLGGFLGLFLGGMIGFAVCTKFAFEKIARNDGSVQPNQALLPFLGVMAGACVGAAAGVVAMRLAFAVYSFAFPEPAEKPRTSKSDNRPSD